MPARILIVEDNATNLELMAYLLVAHGHTVERAGSGLDGLEALAQRPFDLVLADVLMPHMDGLEFVARAKRERHASCPVIAVTALAMVGDKDRIVQGGFDGYIAKPIDPESFVHEVDQHLPAALRSTGVRERSEASAPASAGAASRGRLLLIVDDVPTNLLVIRAAVEPFGYQIVEARSMEDAIAAARVRRPDLVITDVHMPEGTGYDLIRAFKAESGLADVPFIFLSSTYWHDVDRARGLALGAKKFLLRPIEPRTLVDEIEATLES